MKSKKIIFIILAIVTCASSLLFSVSADPVRYPTTTSLPNMLSYAEVNTLSQAISAEASLNNLTSLNFLFITVMKITSSEGLVTYQYFVYTCDFSTNYITGLPEEIAGDAPVVNLSFSDALKRRGYSFTEGGGITAYTSVGTATSFTLRANEQIVYVYKSENSAFNGVFGDNVDAFSSISSSSTYIQYCNTWINALSAFNGQISPNDYQLGYQAGLIEAEGGAYLKGYDAGYSVGSITHAEELEDNFNLGYASGYDDGYRDGKNLNATNDPPVYELNIGEILSGYAASARAFLDSAFDLELFGINIAALLSTLLIVSIVVFIIAFLMKK